MRVSNVDVYYVEVNVVKRSEWEVSWGARWSLRQSHLSGGMVRTIRSKAWGVSGQETIRGSCEGANTKVMVWRSGALVELEEALCRTCRVLLRNLSGS
jgi:hypothetical protein